MIAYVIGARQSCRNASAARSSSAPLLLEQATGHAPATNPLQQEAGPEVDEASEPCCLYESNRCEKEAVEETVALCRRLPNLDNCRCDCHCPQLVPVEDGDLVELL